MVILLQYLQTTPTPKLSRRPLYATSGLMQYPIPEFDIINLLTSSLLFYLFFNRLYQFTSRLKHTFKSL